MASVEGTYLGGLLFLVDGLRQPSGGMKPISCLFCSDDRCCYGLCLDLTRRTLYEMSHTEHTDVPQLYTGIRARNAAQLPTINSMVSALSSLLSKLCT